MRIVSTQTPRQGPGHLGARFEGAGASLGEWGQEYVSMCVGQPGRVSGE